MFKGTLLEFENGLTVGNGCMIDPTVSSYKVDTSDVDLDSKRSTAGYMKRNRIRGGKEAAHTVSVYFQRLSWEDLEKLIDAGDAEQFTLKFLDPGRKGRYFTGIMYRDANMSYELVNIETLGEATWSTTMTFVEF